MQEPTEKDFPSHTPMMQQYLHIESINMKYIEKIKMSKIVILMKYFDN
jgi:hypothetical protein